MQRALGAPALSQPGTRHGMVLPFQPVTLTFRDVHYYVSVPAVSSDQAGLRASPP